MPTPLLAVIQEACRSIRGLPETDTPLRQLNELGIDRGKYDMTLPIRDKLVEALQFLERFESINSDSFPSLPESLVRPLVADIDRIKGIAEEIPIKCQRQTTNVVPPSFHGAEATVARSVDTIYGRIYSQLVSFLPQAQTGSPAKPESQPLSNGLPIRPVEPGKPGGFDAISESERVVFPLYGIRTRGEWQSAFADLGAIDKWKCRRKRWNFGRFSLFQFLWPFGPGKKIKWFEATYGEEVNDRGLSLGTGELPSVVAHSFGTYIVGWALFTYEHLRLNKVILCGSILPTDFRWDLILQRGQVRAVRNEFGVKDIWVKLVRFFVPRTGPSGAYGFAYEHPRLQQQRFEFNHSEYFADGHMKAFWIPFLNRREPAIPEEQTSIERPKRNQPVALYVIVLVVLFMLASPAMLLVSNRSIPREIVSSTGMKLEWIEPLKIWVGEHEVTQAEYRSVIGTDPSLYKGERNPVDKVLLDEAKEFCRKLTDVDRKLHILKPNMLYRLPREAEFATYFDAATAADAVTSLTEKRDRTMPVGSFAPNRYGLYDVIGNVWEWMDNGTLKGGCFDTTIWRDIQANFSLPPDPNYARYNYQNFGFRCVLTRGD